MVYKCNEIFQGLSSLLYLAKLTREHFFKIWIFVRSIEFKHVKVVLRSVSLAILLYCSWSIMGYGTRLRWSYLGVHSTNHHTDSFDCLYKDSVALYSVLNASGKNWTFVHSFSIREFAHFSKTFPCGLISW